MFKITIFIPLGVFILIIFTLKIVLFFTKKNTDIIVRGEIDDIESV